MPMREIHIEPMFQRGKALHSKMPFSKVRGGIAGLLEDFTQGWRGRIDPCCGLNVGAFLIRAADCLRSRF